MAGIREVLSKNLNLLLAEKKVSQSNLAKDLKTSFQTINGLVNGRKGISEEMVSKLSEYFNIEETDLLSPDLFQRKIGSKLPSEGPRAVPASQNTDQSEGSAPHPTGPRKELLDIVLGLKEPELGAVLVMLRPFDRRKKTNNKKRVS